VLTGFVKTKQPTFGFIQSGDGRRYFFHENDQVDDFELLPGDRVTFDVVDPQPEKGPRAMHVALEVGS